MVLEGDDELVPAGEVAGDVHGDEVGQPAHVLDFLQLQLEVGVEAAVVEAVFEGFGELTGGLGEHNLIDGQTFCLSLVAVALRLLNLVEHGFVGGVVDGSDETLEVGHVVETLNSGRVQVSNLADVLVALGLLVTGIDEAGEGEGVGNNLDGHQVTLELEQVSHDFLGGLVQRGGTEVVEFVEPDLSDTELDLLEGVVLHGVGDEFGVDFDVLVGGGTGGDFVKELTEVDTNGQIDEQVLVKTGVVVTIDGLDVLELGELTEGVGSAHELLKGTSSLKSFNDEDDVVDLVAVEHLREEGRKRVDTLSNEMLDFVHELVLHALTENLDLEFVLVDHVGDVGAVVGVFEDKTELTDVGGLLELLVVVVVEETLAESSQESFGIAVINVGIQHLHTHRHFVFLIY